jgi:sugar phosphate isomerase/epimerase
VNIPPLSLAAGVFPEHAPETVVHAAAAAGFDSVGIWIEPDLWTNARARDVRRRVEDSNLTILDAEVIWIKPGQLDSNAYRSLDIAAELGAPNVLVVSTDPDEGATAKKFAALCHHARPAGINISLEFMAFLAVPDLASALRVLAQADQPNGRLLIDPIHLSRAGGTPADLTGVPQHYFAYAQFCDAGGDMPARGDKAAIRTEALDGRLMPGEGFLPLAELLAVLPENLPLSIELRSKPLRDGWPDPVARARQLLQMTHRYFEERTAGGRNATPFGA